MRFFKTTINPQSGNDVNKAKWEEMPMKEPNHFMSLELPAFITLTFE